MSKYRLSDEGGGHETVEAEDMQDAMVTASSNWRMGDWDTKSVVSVRVAELDQDGKEVGEVNWVEVEVGDDPEPPECTEEEHDFVADVDIVHGLKENPGVFSRGGTRLHINTCCRHCGTYRYEVHVGAQHNPGECDTVRYEDPDELSLAWVASLEE